MTFAFTQDVPIDGDVYARIKEGLGPQLPDGLIAHLAWRIDTGLRYVDVWQSKEQHDIFVEERLHPVVHAELQKRLGSVPPEPATTTLDVIDAWTDRHSS